MTSERPCSEGAVGSLDYTEEERRRLAVRSRAEVPKFGSGERQKLTARIPLHSLRCFFQFNLSHLSPFGHPEPTEVMHAISF